MSRAFFETADDALRGFLPPAFRNFASYRTGRNLKVWYGSENREHYEVQFVSGPGLEVGFHAEHRDPGRNEEVLARLLSKEKAWRKALGRQPEAGAFLGRQAAWRRISEVWDGDGLTDDASVEAAERLGDYIQALEPLRRR